VPIVYLLFADDAISAQPLWFLVIAYTALVASALVLVLWQRSNSRGQEFFGPRDPNSDQVKPRGEVVLFGFLGMILVGLILLVLLRNYLAQIPADPNSPARLGFQLLSVRWHALGNLITLALVLGISFWQVKITSGQQVPWIGLLPNWRDLRNGILLGVVCVPLLYLLQGFLQYLLVYVFQQPRVEHPLIELVRKNKAADSSLFTELFSWIAVSVTLISPVLEELLYRGLLQGWLRAKYQNLAGKVLPPSASVPEIPLPDSDNPYQAPQVRQFLTTAELQRRRLTTWAPIFITSMAFSLAHVGHGPAPITLFFFSLALGYVYEKTGRLAPSIIAHLMLNLTTTVMLWLMISGRIPAE
jgi:membrane protease YdiL (CAAX protease family)